MSHTELLTVDELCELPLTEQNRTHFWNSLSEALTYKNGMKPSVRELERLSRRLGRSVDLLILSDTLKTTVADASILTARFVNQTDHTEETIKLFLDGWCERVLYPLAFFEADRRAKVLSTYVAVFRMVNSLARKRSCPLPVAGKLWRATAALNDKGTLYTLSLHLSQRDDIPKAFILRFFTTHMTPYEKVEALVIKKRDLFLAAVAEYPELAGLPTDLTLDLLLSMPTPDDWWGEEDSLPAGMLHWQSPGERRRGHVDGRDLYERRKV